jgi:hypothetical protein
MAIVNDGDSLNSRHLLNHVPGLVLRLAWWFSPSTEMLYRRKYAISRLHIPSAPSQDKSTAGAASIECWQIPMSDGS